MPLADWRTSARAVNPDWPLNGHAEMFVGTMATPHRRQPLPAADSSCAELGFLLSKGRPILGGERISLPHDDLRWGLTGQGGAHP
jgi:hypothetical protein